MEELMSIKQMAKVMGYNPWTIRDWVKTGQIPSIRLSQRKIRFSPKDVEAWLNSKKREVK